MRGPAALSIALSLIVACSDAKDEPSSGDRDRAPTRTPEPEAARDPHVGALVMISGEAEIHTAARADAPHFPVPRLPDEAARRRVAEVRGVHGDFIELRTIGPSVSVVCGDAFELEDLYELRFFVERSALSPVLSRTKTVEFDDGTRLELAAGVPVDEVGPQGRVAIAGTTLSLALDADDVGLWYEAPEHTSEDDGTHPLPRHGELRYGGQVVRPTKSPLLRADARQRVDGGWLLTFAGPCGRFKLFAEGSDDEDPDFDPDMVARNAGILGVMRQQGGHFLASPDAGAFALEECGPTLRRAITAGTKLTWEVGGAAGVALRDHDLPAAAEDVDGKVCFETSGLRLCAATSTLQQREDRTECGWTTLTGEELGMVGLGIEAKAKGDGAGGFGGQDKSRPQVLQAPAEVSEGLDHDIVRRIVRAHLSELRRCYDEGLERAPELNGRVTIAFRIGASGKVSKSAAQDSTLAPGDKKVETCLAGAVKRWKFPKPEGGQVVSVVYPFILAPS